MIVDDDICLELLIKTCSLADVAAFIIARDDVRAMRAELGSGIGAGPVTVKSGQVRQTLRCGEMNTIPVRGGSDFGVISELEREAA